MAVPGGVFVDGPLGQGEDFLAAAAAGIPGSGAPLLLSVASQRPSSASRARTIDRPLPAFAALADYGTCAGDGLPNSAGGNPWDYYNYTPTNKYGKATGVLLAWEPPSQGFDCGGSWDVNLLFRGEPPHIKFKSLTDGSSKTFLIGEKHVPECGYGYYFNASTNEEFDDNSIYNGDNFPTIGRWAGPGHGLARSTDEKVNVNFGGPHPGICQFVFADGSVRAISTSTDEVSLGYMANRHDGQTINSLE